MPRQGLASWLVLEHMPGTSSAPREARVALCHGSPPEALLELAWLEVTCHSLCP